MEARLADNATADDAARAAAKAAADVDAWNRQRQSWSKLRAGSAKMEQAGAGSRVGPARNSVADSVPRSEVTLLTAGALANLPKHESQRAPGSEPFLKSEKGFRTTERPPAVARTETDQKHSISQQYEITPRFIRIVINMGEARISSDLTHSQAEPTSNYG